MEIKQMTFDEYQELARRTQNKDLNKIEQKAHALHGLAAEVGEIHGIFQKVYQGHMMDYVALKDELGDLLWFIAETCDVCEFTLEDVAQRNISKLRRRYPKGFDEERSVHRYE